MLHYWQVGYLILMNWAGRCYVTLKRLRRLRNDKNIAGQNNMLIIGETQ